MSVRIDVRYEGNLRCKAVHEPSGDVLYTDAPKDNQGEGKRFSPTDMVAAATGACILTMIGIAARNRGIEMGGARAEVVKEMSSVPRRHISRILVDVTLPASIPAEARTVLEKAALACPVEQSLGADTEVAVTFRYS